MHYKTLLQALTGLALVCAAGAASAIVAPPPTQRTYDLGTLGGSPVNNASNIPVTGAYDDYFKFVAGSQPGAVNTTVGIDGSTTGDMTLSYRFGSGNDVNSVTWGATTNVGAVPQDSASGAFALLTSFGSLSAGQTYWFNLSGSGSSAAYSVTLLPVPEPETYAMLLIGLGLMGVIARRRNRQNPEV